MKKALQAAALAAATAAGGAATYTLTPTPEPPARVYFSPHDAARPEASPEAAVILAIGHAGEGEDHNGEIRVHAYGFTSEYIASALIRAKGRGADVQIILDKHSNATDQRSQARRCAEAGIPVFLDGRHAIHHNKVVVIDGKRVITGSYNFTESAEHRNAENLVILNGRKLAAKYLTNWAAHRDHSEPYTPPEK